MRILVTGAKGFVGRNLCAELGNIREGKDRSFGDLKIEEIFEFDVDSDPGLLEEYCQRADFVFNLAGVNRPKEQSEFMAGNFGFAEVLLDTLKKYKNSSPVMISSSTQAELDNPYGQSKRAGEELMFRYSQESGAKVLVYRFPNLFGKWCRPNYNSAVATFCHNIANDLPVTISNRDNRLSLVQKAPAATLETLANALKELYKSNVELKVIGTRHGEKLYETLVTREEMSKSRDLGGYFRIPCDTRDLNYDKYFVEGDENLSKIEDYHSHNTKRLDVEEMKELLLSLRIVREDLGLQERDKSKDIRSE